MHRFQTLPEVLSALRRRLPLIAALTVIGCIISVLNAMNADRSYEATAVLQIEDATLPESLAGSSLEVGQSTRRVALIEQRLMARDNLLRIMDEYDLFNEPANMPVSERIGNMRDAISIREIRNALGGGTSPSGLYITVELGEREKTAAIANELMYSVIEQSRERGVNRARETLDFFTAEQERVRAQIDELSAEMARFQQENAARLPGGLVDLRGQLSSLRDTELDLDRQIVTLQTNSERQREEVLDRQIALLREQRSLVSARMAQIEAQIASAPAVERELNRMQRQMEQLRDEFTLISRRKTEAELGQVLEDRQQTDRFEVLETALVPDLPSSRSRASIATIGGILSLIGAFTVAAVLELMNPAIRTVGHMERALGVSPVIAVPDVGRRAPRNWSRRAAAVAMGPVVLIAGWLGFVPG